MFRSGSQNCRLTCLKKPFIGALIALALVPDANATPGTATGAIVFGVGASIACDRLVRSYMEVTPESEESWYLVWHHVGMEDLAGFAAGTACAIPSAVAGAAAGLVVETTIVGASVTAVGAGTVVLAGKGLSLATRALAPPAKLAVQPARQWLGQIKFGPVAPSSNPLRTRYMERLYAQQKGRDALCKVPLPPLYVGPLWSRRLNPDIHVDHRIPKAKGGTDALSNLQLTASEFNRKKGVLTGYELRSAKRSFCPV